MSCPHDIVERDIAVSADGYCPLCQATEIARLRAALEGLHDWYVEYARINNLHNADGTPATFHELLVAREVLAAKP